MLINNMLSKLFFLIACFLSKIKAIFDFISKETKTGYTSKSFAEDLGVKVNKMCALHADKNLKQ